MNTAASTNIPDTRLADARYPDRTAQGCSCRSIREGAGGISYSYEMLGVNCPQCDSFDAHCNQVDLWNSLTREERRRELVQINNSTAACASAHGGKEPPWADAPSLVQFNEGAHLQRSEVGSFKAQPALKSAVYQSCSTHKGKSG